MGRNYKHKTILKLLKKRNEMTSRTLLRKAAGNIKRDRKDVRSVMITNRGDKQVKVSSVKSIQDKLHALALDERSDREQSEINWNSVIANDKKRVAEVANLIKQYGYIASDRFGKRAEGDAWLVVQHAIHDVPFMKKYLKLMEQRIKEDKDVTANYPLLVDRVAMLENKKQTYGTQFIQNENEKYVPYPIKDMKNIDIYRSKFNMTPFADEVAYFENQSIR